MGGAVCLGSGELFEEEITERESDRGREGKRERSLALIEAAVRSRALCLPLGVVAFFSLPSPLVVSFPSSSRQLTEILNGSVIPGTSISSPWQEVNNGFR